MRFLFCLLLLLLVYPCHAKHYSAVRHAHKTIKAVVGLPNKIKNRTKIAHEFLETVTEKSHDSENRHHRRNINAD